MARLELTAPEVARRAGTNATGIYDILSGKSRSPRLDTLHKIAVRGFGVPLNVLFLEPAEAELDDEIAAAIGMLPVEDRRRFLAQIRAVVEAGAA